MGSLKKNFSTWAIMENFICFQAQGNKKISPNQISIIDIDYRIAQRSSFSLFATWKWICCRMLLKDSPLFILFSPGIGLLFRHSRYENEFAAECFQSILRRRPWSQVETDADRKTSPPSPEHLWGIDELWINRWMNQLKSLNHYINESKKEWKKSKKKTE